MSDLEDEIWDYKSIRKQKTSDQARAGCQVQARKSGVQGKRGGNRKRNGSSKTKNSQSVTSATSAAPQPVQDQEVQGINSLEDEQSTPRKKKSETVKTPSPVTPQNRHSGHCPSCQMPFSILLIQSPRWHVSECLDAASAAQSECPDGLHCSSTLLSHYKRYSHFLLAQSRAGDHFFFSPAGGSPQLTLPRAATSSISNDFSPTKSNTSTRKKHRQLKSSQTSSPSSSQESVRRTSLDVWLSSPAKASQNSFSSSQEASSHVTATKSYPLPQQGTDVCDSTITYSPLVSDQELFSEDEGDLTTPRKTLHPTKLFPDNMSALVTPPHCKNNDNRVSTYESPGGVKMMKTDDWSEYGTPVSYSSEWPPVQLYPEGTANLNPDNQSLVFPYKTEGGAASPILSQPLTVKPEQPAAQTRDRLSQGSLTMASVPSSKTMKQMDIGVFFGLKPKAVSKTAAVKMPLKTQSPNAVTSQPPRKRKATGSLSDVVENVNDIPMLPSTGTQKRGGKRFRQNSTTEEGRRGRKQCPFYKKIPGSGFAVDAFQYGEIEGCSAYFLTHFHSDHYGGLTKKFRLPIYCSKITGNLVQSKLRVEKEFINCLPMYTECMVNGIKVVLLDANHCPGAVLLLFILPNGTTILHTGDFRADTSMERYPALLGRKIHTLYLDTTYCSPEYTFPPQQEAVQFAVNAAFEMVTLHPRTLVVCGTYSVGKEKVFLAIADVLGCKVCMSQDKYKTMQCLESDEIRALVTTDWHSTALHVLPMMQVNFKGLYAHLNKFSGKYDRVLAFKPTGWTYSEGCGSVAEIRPEIRGKVTMYGIPYSEHSSFSEMKRFVQFIKPQKIIPTVNVGNMKSRTTMERYFAEWLSGTKR